MFPKVAPKFFKERANGPVDAATAFAKKETPAAEPASKGGSYTITVNGSAYNVTSDGNGSVTVNGTPYSVSVGTGTAAPATVSAPVATGGVDVKAPVAGTLLKQCFANGTKVSKGQTIIIIESMKMELEVKATADGTITYSVAPGTQIQSGQVLAAIGGVVVQPAPVAKPVASPAALASAAPVSSGNGTKVNAPVAGVFLRTAVAEGASVKKGDNVVIIESMKMELEIKAPVDGKVHFLASAGTQLTNGQPVAEIC